MQHSPNFKSYIYYGFTTHILLNVIKKNLYNVLAIKMYMKFIRFWMYIAPVLFLQEIPERGTILGMFATPPKSIYIN